MIVICMVAETLVEAWVVRAQRKNLCFGGRGHPQHDDICMVAKKYEFQTENTPQLRTLVGGAGCMQCGGVNNRWVASEYCE